MNKFEALGLGEAIIQAVNEMGFETPSEVQEKAIPILLNEDTDIVALAQTGTGKTAAFGFPLIEKVDNTSRITQGLILSPTRELCLQITNELKNYSKFIKGLRTVAIYGGASIHEQSKEIKRGAQIIVATPGRMQDMINRKMVDISNIGYCVLDEADEMLNMGFYEDINAILSHTPEDKCTWLFSATMPKEVATIAKRFMHDPVEITVGHKNTGSKNVSHEYYVVNSRDRYAALKRLADANPDIFSVIFCRTKRDTQKVAENLIGDGYNAAALHGDLSQNQRDLVMKSFRNRQIQMLVATDVAARGIDVDDVTHVINYQLPDEIETYTHRSGRTGRAGKSGVSMVIVSKSGEEICQVQLFHLANDIAKSEINNEIDSYLPSIHEVLESFTKEELIKKFFTVEFSRFHNYYKKAKDLNVSRESGGDSGGRDGSTRYFINVGEKDGFDWMTLKDFLKETLGLGRDGISRVDVKESFSFFNTDSQHQELILSVFEDFKMEGRKVNVEISKDSRRGSGGRRKRDHNGGFKGKRRSEGFKPKGRNRRDNDGGSRGNSGRRDRRKRSDRR